MRRAGGVNRISCLVVRVKELELITSTALPTPLPGPVEAVESLRERQIRGEATGVSRSRNESRDMALQSAASKQSENGQGIDVVVVHYNAPGALAECIEPLTGELNADSNLSLVVIDNDAQAPAKAIGHTLEQLDRASYRVMPSNDGFGAASNIGAREGSAPFVLFLNPDCVIAPEAIATLAKTLEQNPDIVAVGPRIERPNGQPEISWAHHPGFLWEARRRRLWRALSAAKPWALDRARELVSSPRDVEWLTAACLMVRRDAFEAIGGFDEDFFLYFEDADLGLRLGKYGRLRFQPEAHARHRGGASTAKDESGTLPHYRASQNLYYVKHRPLWERLGLRLWRVLKP